MTTTSHRALIQNRIDESAARTPATDEEKAAVLAMIPDEAIPGRIVIDVDNALTWTTAKEVEMTLESLSRTHRSNIIFMLETWIEDPAYWAAYRNDAALGMLLRAEPITRIHTVIGALEKVVTAEDLHATPLVRRLVELGV